MRKNKQGKERQQLRPTSDSANDEIAPRTQGNQSAFNVQLNSAEHHMESIDHYLEHFRVAPQTMVDMVSSGVADKGYVADRRYNDQRSALTLMTMPQVC